MLFFLMNQDSFFSFFFDNRSSVWRQYLAHFKYGCISSFQLKVVI